MISIIIPTIEGREESLQRAFNAYSQTTPPGTEILVTGPHETCGEAWQSGAQKVSGDYICFGADDHEALPGWWEPLVEAIDVYNVLPCSVVFNPDGSVQSAGMSNWQPHEYIPRDWHPVEHTLTPFVSRRQLNLVAPIPPIHFCSDLWFSARLRHFGIPTIVRTGSHVIHHNHPVGRGAGVDENLRNVQDRILFARYLQEAA